MHTAVLGVFWGCDAEHGGLDSVLALVLIQHREVYVLLNLIIRLFSRTVLLSFCFTFNLKIIRMTGFHGEGLAMDLLTHDGAEVMHAGFK